MWRKIQGFFIVFIGLVFFISCSDSKDSSVNEISLQDSKKYVKDSSLDSNLSNFNPTQTPYTTPLDIESYAKKYKEFMESKGADSQNDTKIDSKNDKKEESSKNPNLEISKVTKDLDNEFLFLRKKYKDNENVLNDLKKCCGCVRPDCSSTKINDEYFYDTSDILEAFESAILDKNTQILSNVETLQNYDYVLKSKQTTSIDLSALNPQNTELSYIKFEWLNDSNNSSPNILKITLSPKENICAESQYNIITTFLQGNFNGKNAVKTTKYKEKLPSFLYPADLVYFVRQSCACAMSLGNIANLSQSAENSVEISEFKLSNSKSLQSNEIIFESNVENTKSSKNPNLENFKVPKDYYKFLPANIKYCDDLESKRATFWEKYMQDSRVIKILQNEQKMYKQEFQNDEDLDSKNSKDSNNLQDLKDSIESKREDSKKDSKDSKTPKDSKTFIESNISKG